ncbi:MAG: hypothetical protein WCQ32_00210 [bacterium]
MKKNLLNLFFVATDNLSLLEIGFQDKGDTGSPSKKALYLMVKNKKDFQLVCKEFVTRKTKNLGDCGCMCDLGRLKAISKLTGFSITKHTEGYIRERYINSKCTSIEGENILSFLRNSRG